MSFYEEKVELLGSGLLKANEKPNSNYKNYGSWVST